PGAPATDGAPAAAAGAAQGGRGAAAGRGTFGTSTCTNTGGAGGQVGVIRGPSSVAAADQGANAAMMRAQLAGQSPWRWTGKVWENTGAPAPDPSALPAGRGGAGRGAAPARGPGAPGVGGDGP